MQKTDVKNKLIEYLKNTNDHCLIIHPEIDRFQGFKNVNCTLPSTSKFPTTKFKITNLKSVFEIRTSEDSLKQEIFVIVNPVEEIYSLALYIRDLSKKDDIDFQSLGLLAEEAKKSLKIEAENFKAEDKEVVNHLEFRFSGKVVFYTPTINISNQELETLKVRFKESGANLRIITERDVDIKIKYNPKNIEDIKTFVYELKEILRNDSEEVESVFQNKLESNIKVLDLYGKRFISQPKGFTNEKKNIQGYQTLIPDFLVEYYDGTVNLVEIERPNKNPIRKNGNPTEKLTQALSQIKQWESLLTQPKISQKLMKTYPEINNPQKRKYTLIFGRNKHFKNESEKNEFFNQNRGLTSNLEILTFDDFITKTEKVIDNIAYSKKASPWL